MNREYRIFGLFLFFTLIFAPSVSAQSVDLVWQADTYTPPLYKGLPLWTNESRITLVAIPQIANASSLIYRWKKDGVVLGMSSGVNKRSLSFSDSVLSLPVEIELDLFVEEGASPVASARTVIRPTGFKLVAVEDSPLLGLLLNRAVAQNFDLGEKEVSFVALPFFADVTTRFAPVLSYSWTTNTGDKREENRVTYRAPEEGSGSASVTLRVTNARTLAQPAGVNFLIRFNNNEL